MSDREYLSRQQAILLAAAGLRPDNGGATSPCPTPTMSPGAWHRFKVRPNNSPQRRIMAMSYLLLRYRQNGVLASLLEKIIQAPISQGHIFLEHGLTVTTGGSRPFTFLGRDRAADIIVNALLPFAFAYGKVNLYPQLMRKSLALYGTYPRLVANAIERHMKEQLGVSEDVVNSARRQQGLLHIYQTRCTRGKCCACFFGTQASLREATTSMSRPSTLAALRRK
jgi:hypothetical protein